MGGNPAVMAPPSEYYMCDSLSRFCGGLFLFALNVSEGFPFLKLTRFVMIHVVSNSASLPCDFCVL